MIEQGEKITDGHTPGPWKTTGLTRHGFHYKVRGTRLGGKFAVANCPFAPESRLDKAEAEANANLIAAAPELLTALLLARDIIRHGKVRAADLEAIDGVLAKATNPGGK